MAVWRWLMSSWVPGREICCRQLINPLGAPAASAARRIASTDSKVQRAADGWGATIMALRALTAIRHLKKAVEVGLVDGTSAATTPIGQAISYRRWSGSWRITPTVFWS